MKDETRGVVIKECEHKKVKGMKKNIVTTISHSEYKDVMRNRKCRRLWILFISKVKIIEFISYITKYICLA